MGNELYVCYDEKEQSGIAFQPGYIYSGLELIASSKKVMTELSKRYDNIKVMTLSDFKKLNIKNILIRNIKSVNEFDNL